AKMGRRQCKSAYNIIKNKTTPESSPPPTPKSDYCNADKAEENDLKKSLMKMLEEAFEEKMKNVSKEIGENTNKKLEEINKEIEEKKSKKLEEMNNEIEEKKNKKLEEMNNEIEEKKNKRVEEMNKEIEEKRNKKLQELDKEIEEKINKKLKEMNKEIEEKTNKKLEEINKMEHKLTSLSAPTRTSSVTFPTLHLIVLITYPAVVTKYLNRSNSRFCQSSQEKAIQHHQLLDWFSRDSCTSLILKFIYLEYLFLAFYPKSICYSLFIVIESFAGYSSLGLLPWSLSICNMSVQSLLDFNVFIEKSDVIILLFPFSDIEEIH
ncbi:hypothetical protein STEG23_016055, partial [Scotinomys teguina]